MLGDKYDSLVEKKQDASEAIADAIATTAPVAAEIVGNIGAAAANSLPAAAGDGFHYTNIRLESVTPDDFYDPDTGSVFSQQAAYGNDLSTDGGAKGTSKLRDWLANKFNRDDELPDVRAAAPYVSGSASASVSGSASASVSGYTGAPQQPAPPLTPEESFREDLTSKRDLLMGMLKETNDAMRQRMEARRGRADDSTQALLDMLKDVDDELERRIS